MIKDIKTESIKLKNGLLLVLAPQKNSPSVTIGVFVKAGASYENKKQNGISHFLEHLCFKGTKKRPTQEIIASEFEEIGASYNAFTERDYTGYYAKVAYPYFEKAFDIISDIYLNSQIKVPLFEEEKRVIVEEINMYNDDPQARAYHEMLRLLYGDSPAGRDIAGSKNNVLSFKVEDVEKYKRKFYTAKNTVVLISGNFDAPKIRRLAEEKFAAATSGKQYLLKTDEVISNGPKRKIKIVEKPLDQMYISIGFKSFPYGDKRNFAISFLASILGGTLSSRLVQEVRNKLGAAYYIYSAKNLYSTHGFLSIHAGISKNKLEKSLKSIIEQLEKIKKYGPTEKEVEKTRKNMISRLILARETSDKVLFSAGEDIMKLGKIRKLNEIKSEIMKVKAEDTKEVAKNILNLDKMKLAIVGQYKKVDNIEKIL